MPRKLVIAALGGALMVSGCTTYRETQPAHTATEELLTSHSTEIAAEKLAAALPIHQAVFLDVSHFKGDNTDYAISAVNAAMLRHGTILVPDKKSSKVTMELRAGALSIDQKDEVFGLPAMTLPIPGTLTALPIPEIALYSANQRMGVAEFSAFLYDSNSGAPLGFAGPVAGQRRLVTHRYLFFFGNGKLVEKPHNVPGPSTP
jgi:hypothetical protein